MRISSQMFFMRNTTTVMDQQSKLSEQNIHLASQKRVLHGSDDPVAIATIQRLKQDLSIGEQFIKNGEMAQSANELSDTSLTQSINILQRVRELMVSGSNGTMSEANREVIAVELENLRDELMGVANTKDGNSQYIFAGFQVDTKPFQKNEFGEITYQGDSGEREYRIGSGVSIQGNDSGAKLFMEIPEGNGTFVSELGSNNSGAGVISEGTVVDKNAASDYLDQDYTIAMTDPTGSGEPDYSVYGLKEDAVTGSANIKISSIDLSDPNIASVDPTNVGDSVDITFIATANPNEFNISINGQVSSDIYDASDTTTQEININGISIEIDNADGNPIGGD
ncbi:flagellar hook-associated protein FlgL, partial [Psychromonas sp.]|nr:flagellar hook-associated protein FlgL [Psychromonas sp.]